MKHLIVMVSVCALAACGPSEDEIRADERAKILEGRVAQLEAERSGDGGTETGVGTSAEHVTHQASAPTRAQPAQRDSVVQESSAPSTRLVASYNAFIGEQDLYNSAGKRLSAPWQVLRQDRANYHRYGVAQAGDESDPFFSSAKNRATMERMVANGAIDRNAGRRITSGGVSVRVEIYGSGSGGDRVNVTVR